MNAERRQQLRQLAERYFRHEVTGDEIAEAIAEIPALLDTLEQAEAEAFKFRHGDDLCPRCSIKRRHSGNPHGCGREYGLDGCFLAALAPAGREQGSAPDGGAGAET